MGKEELDLIRETAKWKLPDATQRRLDGLLDKKMLLTKQEKRELDALVAVNDELSLIKARAMRILKQRRSRVA